MKTKLTLLFLLSTFIAFAVTDIYKNDSIVSTNIGSDESIDSCIFVSEKSTDVRKVIPAQLTEQEMIQLTDFFGGIGDFFTAIGHFFSKSTFGYYKENGQNGHGPYTLFDRTSPKSITQQLTSYPPYFQVLPIRQIAHW
jgi:hypothetical protein